MKSGLIKNRYVGRTFIQPSQELREQGVKMKLSPYAELWKENESLWSMILSFEVRRVKTNRATVQRSWCERSSCAH